MEFYVTAARVSITFNAAKYCARAHRLSQGKVVREFADFTFFVFNGERKKQSERILVQYFYCIIYVIIRFALNLTGRRAAC